MGAIWKPSNNLLMNPKWACAQTWLEAFGQQGDLELLKSFCSSIQDVHHGGKLENVETTSATEW